MRTSDFDYELPEELIAQEPAAVRDECRLLVLDRADGAIEDRIFKDVIDYLEPGDLLIANETRVIPARLLGKKHGTGGAAEILLLRECGGPEPRTNKVAFWEALVRPGKRLKPGSGAAVDFFGPDGETAMTAEMVDWVHGGQKGERIVRISTELDSLDEALHAVGRTPLPPYIRDYAGDDEMYQTVYSKRESSAAAPTAGLHFTSELIEQCRNRGIGWATVELEVGLDTFRIVDEEDPLSHSMHTETYTVPAETVKAIEGCKAAGGRVIAVGTTSVRSLESAWHAKWDRSWPHIEHTADRHSSQRHKVNAQGETQAPSSDAETLIDPLNRASTSLFLLPGSEFHVVDGLITNFHVPRSTLMMLVSAFASRNMVMKAYEHAIEERYRMLSFGDAMLIL